MPHLPPTSSPRAIWAVASLAVAMAVSGTSDAHSGHAERVADLDARIADAPRDILLLLRRADLHRRHKDWNKAFHDLAKASALDPASPSVALLKAQTLLDQGEAHRALETLGTHLSSHPAGAQPAELQVLVARASTAVGRPEDAIAAYRSAAASLPQSTPDFYLEYADALLSSHAPDAPAQAVAALDDGAQRLGFPPALEQRALEIELERSKFADAAERCRRVLARPGRALPQWQIHYGTALLELGKPAAAGDAFQRALDHFASLPPTRSGAPAIRSLHHKATAGLARATTAAEGANQGRK